MTSAAKPDAIETATSERLRAHVSAILDVSGMPSAEREDVGEEMYAHLAEGVLADVARGSTWSAAADRAIATFGGVDQIGPALSRVYHSDLWMSTIGVLLPAVANREDRPAVVAWLRLLLGIGIVLTVLGLALTTWRATPVHGVVTAAVLLGGLAGLLLAFRAIARGQRWALWYAIAIAVELVVFGVASVIAPETPGTLTIPIGGLLAAGVLMAVRSSWDRLNAFVGGSRPIGSRMRLALAASVVAPALITPAMMALPDPSQAQATDLELRVAVRCDRGAVTEAGMPPRPDLQRVTVVADTVWRRGDLLPNGLDGLFNGAHYGDTAGFRLAGQPMDGSLPEWLLVTNDVPVVDLASGRPAGWFGSTSPSVELIPPTIGSFTVGIESAAIRPGATLRTTWLLSPVADRGAAWPQVEVTYAHLDRFLISATAGCGEHSVGREVPLPAMAPQQQADPFGFPAP